jgi:hypothetical protein
MPLRNYHNQEVNIDLFKTLADQSTLFKLLLRLLLDTDQESELEAYRLKRGLEEMGAHVTYEQAVTMLRSLDNHGVGWFKIGRRGKQTRFIFDVDSKELASAILEPTAAATPTAPSVPTTSAGAETTLVKHRFWLRPGIEITVELPVDVTEKDVARLYELLKAIPFDSVGRRVAA